MDTWRSGCFVLFLDIFGSTVYIIFTLQYQKLRTPLSSLAPCVIMWWLPHKFGQFNGFFKNLIFFLLLKHLEIQFKWNIIYSFSKTRFFQFAFLENCIVHIKKQKKSIKYQSNFCSNTFFKVFANSMSALSF